MTMHNHLLPIRQSAAGSPAPKVSASVRRAARVFRKVKGSAEISAKSMTKNPPPHRLQSSFIHLDELSGFPISYIADHGTLSMLGAAQTCGIVPSRQDLSNHAIYKAPPFLVAET